MRLFPKPFLKSFLPLLAVFASARGYFFLPILLLFPCPSLPAHAATACTAAHRSVGVIGSQLPLLFFWCHEHGFPFFFLFCANGLALGGALCTSKGWAGKEGGCGGSRRVRVGGQAGGKERGRRQREEEADDEQRDNRWV